MRLLLWVLCISEVRTKIKPYVFYQIQTEVLTGISLHVPRSCADVKNKDYILQGIMAFPLLSALLCSFVLTKFICTVSGVFHWQNSSTLWTHHSDETLNCLAKRTDCTIALCLSRTHKSREFGFSCSCSWPEIFNQHSRNIVKIIFFTN